MLIKLNHSTVVISSADGNDSITVIKNKDKETYHIQINGEPSEENEELELVVNLTNAEKFSVIFPKEKDLLRQRLVSEKELYDISPNPDSIFTLVEVDGEWYFSKGLHVCNRVCLEDNKKYYLIHK